MQMPITVTWTKAVKLFFSFGALFEYLPQHREESNSNTDRCTTDGNKTEMTNI
jgi:hypothetical protein